MSRDEIEVIREIGWLFKIILRVRNTVLSFEKIMFDIWIDLVYELNWQKLDQLGIVNI